MQIKNVVWTKANFCCQNWWS